MGNEKLLFAVKPFSSQRVEFCHLQVAKKGMENYEFSHSKNHFRKFLEFKWNLGRKAFEKVQHCLVVKIFKSWKFSK